MASIEDNPEQNLSAQEIDARRAHHLWERAVTLMERGERDAAALSCRQAIALTPNYAEPYSLLGSILHRIGDFKGAISAYEKFLSLRPGATEERQALEDLLQLQPAATVEAPAANDGNIQTEGQQTEASAPTSDSPAATPIAVAPLAVEPIAVAPIAVAPAPENGTPRDFSARELGEQKSGISWKTASLAAIALSGLLLLGFVMRSMGNKGQDAALPIAVNGPVSPKTSTPPAEPSSAAPSAPDAPPAPPAPGRAAVAPPGDSPGRAAAPASRPAPATQTRTEVTSAPPTVTATAPPASSPTSAPTYQPPVENPPVAARSEARRPAPAVQPNQSQPFTPGGRRVPVTGVREIPTTRNFPSPGGSGAGAPPASSPSPGSDRTPVEHPVSPSLSRP